MIKHKNDIPLTIIDNIDAKWAAGTIYNHYESPVDFMNDVIANVNDSNTTGIAYINSGIEKYKQLSNKDISYSKLYQDVAKKVKDSLVARGFTTALLYKNVNFTAHKTGCLSKHRAMLGKRDCYFEDTNMTDSKLFHDIFINTSYYGGISDKIIEENSYALYALTKELSSLIPIRVFIVNHVGLSHTKANINICYSYCLKRFRQPIQPQEFLFFTAEAKRTFGFGMYNILADTTLAKVGNPVGTVNIADFNLDTEIKTIWDKYNTINGKKYK